MRRTGSVFAFGSRIAGTRSFFAVKCTVVVRARFLMACTHRMGRKCCPKWTTTGGFQSQHWHWTRLTRVWCAAIQHEFLFTPTSKEIQLLVNKFIWHKILTTPCPNVEAEAVRQPIEDVLKRVSLKLDSFFTNQKKCFLSERAVTVQIFFRQVKRLHGKFSCQSLCWIFCCWSSKNFAGLLSRKG